MKYDDFLSAHGRFELKLNTDPAGQFSPAILRSGQDGKGRFGHLVEINDSDPNGTYLSVLIRFKGIVFGRSVPSAGHPCIQNREVGALGAMHWILL